MKVSPLTYVAQVVAALVLLFASSMKLSGDPSSVVIFQDLGMEPTGRIVIGVVELSAGLLLLSPLAASGALLAVCVMCGAIIAHISQLGVQVDGDGGMLFGMLFLVLLAAGHVLWVRRRQLPLVGGTL